VQAAIKNSTANANSRTTFEKCFISVLLLDCWSTNPNNIDRAFSRNRIKVFLNHWKIPTVKDSSITLRNGQAKPVSPHPIPHEHIC
jgi:hypothetical protein